MDDEYEQEYHEQSAEEKDEAHKQGMISALPTLDHYNRTYGRSISEDRKALRIFRDYESNERTKRLQSELMLIRDMKVAEKTLDRVVGKKKKMKYEGYSRWASLMLQWLNSKK